MKLSEIKIVVKNLKPRDPNHQILAAKKNAAGEHRDKKRELKNGVEKYRRQIPESEE